MGNQSAKASNISTLFNRKQRTVQKKFPYRKEDWYINLTAQEQQLADLIYKNHDYYSKQDKHYRKWVRVIKFIILLITLANTIILGVKGILEQEVQVNVGLILSAIISFITALFTYFNLEEYWMRNISIHIKYNILRDEFMLKAKAGAIDQDSIDGFVKTLKSIQEENIEYWQKASKKI